MITQDLGGTWYVWHVPHKQSIEPMLAPDFVPEGWLDAQVPEEIHAVLRRHGYIKGHHYGKSFEDEKWIEEVDWLYTRAFYADESLRGEKVCLRFEGLDTFCEVYLNGIKIAFADNMHRTFEWDVSEQLRYGARNTLLLRFLAAPKHVESFEEAGLYSTDTLDRIKARKAQMNYSWDFVGRCVTAGIWKPVRLIAHDAPEIENHYVYTRSIDAGCAVVGVEARYVYMGEGEFELATRISRGGETVYESRVPAPREGNAFDVPIENAALWWPRPYGEPALYDIELTLCRAGECVARAQSRFGIRTFEIIQEDQEDGRSFIFAVNGRRLFIRGANWVPIRAVYTDIRDAEYDALIRYAVEGNLSMLRVWGGGIYESDRFFELCDEQGIMIWHDFMLACGIFPQDDAFLQNLYLEARDNVLRCRNHASLVLWAGDNENDEAYTWAGRPYDYKYDKTNRVALANACRDFDPHRAYIPSSPYSPFEFYKGGDNPKSPHQGDMHLYITNTDLKNRGYYKNIRCYRPRFMSEFGFCCLPERETFYQYNFLRRPLTGYEMIEHTFARHAEIAQGPEDFEALIDCTQLYNALAFKYWIEYMRSLKWTCAGTLYWKFNDPMADNNAPRMLFPTLMSTVDFMTRPKQTFYYTKRAYDDVLVTLFEAKQDYEVYGISEITRDVRGPLTISRMDFEGNVLDSLTLDAVIARDASTLLARLPYARWKAADATREYIKLSLGGECAQVNRYLYADLGELHTLALRDVRIALEVRREKDALVATLTAPYFVKDARLAIHGVDAHYSDNYIDLDANAATCVRIALPEGCDLRDKLLTVSARGVRARSIPLA